MIISVKRSDIRLDDMRNINRPEHGQWYAGWVSPNPARLFLGCPMGRGNTEDSAIADLIARTQDESNVSIVLE